MTQQNPFYVRMSSLVTGMLAVAFCSPFSVGHAQSEAGDQDTDCGAHVLYVAARAFNRGPLFYEEFREGFVPSTDDGYTVDDLVSKAKELGLNPLAVSCSAEDLEGIPSPFACILHIDENHFTLLLGINGQVADVLDPQTAKPTKIDLGERWNGGAVLLSDREISMTSGRFVTVIKGFALVVVGLVIVSVLFKLLRK